METLLDVIGVLMIIWGSFVALVVTLQVFAIIFIGKDEGLKKSTTGLLAFVVFLLSGGFAAALIWGGYTVTGINSW